MVGGGSSSSLGPELLLLWPRLTTADPGRLQAAANCRAAGPQTISGSVASERGRAVPGGAFIASHPSHPQPASWIGITSHVSSSFRVNALPGDGKQRTQALNYSPHPTGPGAPCPHLHSPATNVGALTTARSPQQRQPHQQRRSPGEGSHPPSLFTHLCPSKE